ncbi:TPA: hypothetical protein ND688_003195 [Pseudomonas aeruginosa]|uniref:hypothetical protein n=1 Tax=Pseudomonas aeruginosa TaxID=287 RepID=UPI00163B0219|nr:hypothetical protein [Pseudomonas aeruginosa]HBO4202887.1 hypothetical protein [Pseudomonas aeruginosa]HCD6605936.1 hypothetical protein [Pseudomonas aeruginosa]HCD7429473.1 hypothetical protein [Pseudomonas aeruginosa]HCD8079329.1 hypothetical protein [Pseudomonas aeruginosa]HEJ6111829.1 hypothetical protein [Pseudomonas aeruginosa]
MTNELNDVRCPCGAEFQADSYDAGFIAGSGMCQNCDAAMPPKDIPAPVEQAGGDERAVDGKPRATKCPDCGEGDLMPGDLCACGYETDPAAGYACSECDGSGDGYVGEVCRECDGSGWFVTPEQARAALAQPSGEVVVTKNESGAIVSVTRQDKDGRVLSVIAESATLTAQAEQAEAERPEVVAVMESNGAGGKRLAQRFPIVNVFVGDELMTVAQHERIVKAWIERWKAYIELSAKIAAQRDAALARVAELEKQEPVAWMDPRSPEMHATISNEVKQHNMRIGNASASAVNGYSIPLYAAPVAQAQPEETPGEILAAKLIETWVTKHGKPAPWSTAVEITAVATNMPNDERDRLLALDDDVDAQAQHSVPGKYDDVLLPFLKLMEHELHANAGKGDRPGWLQMDRRTALLEIYYHLAKLQKATKDNDAAGIVEYAADVANMSMMLVDVCGLLAAAPGKEGV